MDLGRCAPRRAVTSRSSLVLMLLGIVVAMVVATGCSPAPPGAQAAAGPTVAASQPRPYTLSRQAASRAVTDVARTLRSLQTKVTRCPGGPACHPVHGSAWDVSAQRDAAPIADGNGITASAYLGVVAFDSPRAARRFVARIRGEQRRYAGTFSIAVKPGAGDRYTPGEQGVGSLDAQRRGGWDGWVLDLQHAYAFWDGSMSVQEYTRRFMARRGRFVCAAFLDGRSLPELRDVLPAWDRLVTALDG
ncbi:MAG: hypothetical protein QM747_00350 [Nocardioides sp.]